MAFKMKGFPMQATASAPMKQTTTELRKKRDKAEIAFNNQLAEEGFSTDTDLSNASEKLLALQNKFEELRKPFIKENMEKLEKSTTFKQMGPVTKSNIGLLETENKDANVYKGKNLQERINDYEDRIEFLNSDLDDFGQQPGQDPSKIKKDIKKLNQELEILEKIRANKTGR
jgi:hypothetical protein